MTKSKSLFVTSKDDSHADYLIDILNKSGKSENVIRLNTEDFISNCIVTFSEEHFNIEIKDSGRVLEKDEISSVWYRRPKDFLYQVADDKETAFIHKQSNALLRGIYFSTHDTAKWINPLTGLHRARIKLQQLILAKSLGFNVPKTIVSNKPSEILDFIKKVENVSTKSLDEPNFQTDKYVYPLFNRKLEKEFIETNSQYIESCPTLFQEYIEKKSDIRVVVIGTNIFSFEIFSQENELSIEDFRGVSPSNLRHEQIILPSSLQNLILTYVCQQNLIYSSLDFVRAKDDKYYFIENNPNGQWLWLELNTGIKISAAFIKELQL
jgi:glutathione synthase/RimK-type ligase-like ATP-grasp enzyme